MGGAAQAWGIGTGRLAVIQRMTSSAIRFREFPSLGRALREAIGIVSGNTGCNQERSRKDKELLEHVWTSPERTAA